MKKKLHLVVICILGVIFIIAAAQPVHAAERVVKLIVPGCEWPVTAGRVGDALKEIPGVLQYDANQFTHEVIVKFDDTKTSIDTIVERLAKKDFPVEGKPQIVR